MLSHIHHHNLDKMENENMTGLNYFELKTN